MLRRLAVVAGGVCLAALGQISPGPLSKVHADLNGPANCSACHVFGARTPQLKCLGCHTEIRDRLASHSGFHARVVHNRQGLEDCARCHAEHVGQDANIVRWSTPVEKFDHSQTGYPLEGKHAGLACRSCHTPEHIARAVRPAIRLRDLRRTWLGLSPECITCHVDEHHGQLGTDCAHCHNVQGWKPVAVFDHRLTRFPLTGLHQSVSCAACHHTVQQDGRPVTQFRGLAFQLCSDCHKDPHRSAFPGACESCHNTSGWKRVRLANTFDHSRTAFPLRGAHADVGCFRCHGNSDFRKPVAHTLCADCHTPDPHKGQFVGQDCASCHNETSFKPSLFTLARHQKTEYPLNGKHLTVACDQCHIPAGKDTVYKMKHDACADCHKDAHAGQFAAAPWKNRCDACHTMEGFQHSTFTLAQHQKSRFPLTESHAATPCVDCHRPPAGSFPPGPVQYRFASLSCETCHRSPHDSSFRGLDKGGCESCHTVRSWKDLRVFDHDSTGFTLLGAHRTLTCIECHRPSPNAGSRTIVFHDTATACNGCHEDAHGGQFGASGTTCSGCHNNVAWRPSIFDHERQSHFSLKGAHEAVPCRDCHTQTEQLNGRTIVVYRDAPSVCSECHSDKSGISARGKTQVHD